MKSAIGLCTALFFIENLLVQLIYAPLFLLRGKRTNLVKVDFSTPQLQCCSQRVQKDLKLPLVRFVAQLLAVQCAVFLSCL